MAIAIALSACSTDGPSPEPSPTPSPVVTPSPTPTPSPSPSPEPVEVVAGNLVDLVGVTVEASTTGAPSTDASGNPVTYDAANVLDGDPNTAWRTAWDYNDPYLLIRFDQPVEIQSVGLIPGYAKKDPATGTDRFKQNLRVAYATWTFSDGTDWRQEPTDDPTMQTIPVSGNVTWIRLTIWPRDYWEVDSENVAISDIQLIGKPAT